MQHKRSRRSRAVSLTTTAVASVVAAVGGASLAATATAATSQEMQAAVALGAAYLPTVQKDDGNLPGFGGDWALTSLAAAGVDAGTVRLTPVAPSAQDYFLGVWTGGPSSNDDWTSPSGQKPGASPGTLRRPATDYERALLLAHAAGLPPTRLSADQNLVAQLAGIYRGRPAVPDGPDVGRSEGNFGSVGLFNGTVYGLLSLSRTAVPQVLLDTIAQTIVSNQHDDGGWTFSRVTSAPARAGKSDIDMTGAALAALCDAGAGAADPVVERGVAFLASKLAADGSFASSYTSSGNTDSAAWATSGLNACGIDPNGPRFTSGAGKTPIDFLLGVQFKDGPDAGAFRYLPTDTRPNYYASQDAVRALAGESFSAQPKTVRAAPAVADGTVVPQAIVIDAGTDSTGERDLRFCRVYAPTGASVAELLQQAATTAEPAGCVTGLDVRAGSVEALNGVSGDRALRRWLVRLDGGAARVAGPQPVCHGQIVSLYIGRTSDATSAAAPSCSAGPVDPGIGGPDPGTGTGTDTPQPPSPEQPSPGGSHPTVVLQPATTVPPVLAGLAVVGSGAKQQRAVRPDRRGRIRVTLDCPSDAGANGCWSIVTAQAKVRLTPRGEARERRVGGRTIAVASGKRRTITVQLNAALRRDLQRAGKRAVRLQVRTRGAGAAATGTRTVRVLLHARR